MNALRFQGYPIPKAGAVLAWMGAVQIRGHDQVPVVVLKRC